MCYVKCECVSGVRSAFFALGREKILCILRGGVLMSHNNNPREKPRGVGGIDLEGGEKKRKKMAVIMVMGNGNAKSFLAGKREFEELVGVNG